MTSSAFRGLAGAVWFDAEKLLALPESLNGSVFVVVDKPMQALYSASATPFKHSQSSSLMWHRSSDLSAARAWRMWRGKRGLLEGQSALMEH